MKAVVRSTLLSLCVLQATACSQQIDVRSSLAGESLLQASKQGDLAAVNALLEDEAKVNVRDACHWTPPGFDSDQAQPVADGV